MPSKIREFRIGHIRGAGITNLVLDVVREMGFDEAEGIRLKAIQGSMEELDQGLASGSMDMIRRGPDSDMVASVAQGGSIKVVATVANKPVGDLVVCPQCHSIAELRGKQLAVIHPRLGTTVFLRHLLWQHGLGNEDCVLVTIGETPLRYEALKSGRVSGTILLPPQSWQAKKEGFRVLASLPECYPLAITTSFQVNQLVAKQKRRDVVSFLRALVRAHRWVYAPENMQSLLAVLEGKGMTPEQAQRDYTFNIENKGLARDCVVDLSAIEQMVDLLTDIGELKRPAPHADYFVDSSYLEEALAGLD